MKDVPYQHQLERWWVGEWKEMGNIRFPQLKANNVTQSSQGGSGSTIETKKKILPERNSSFVLAVQYISSLPLMICIYFKEMRAFPSAITRISALIQCWLQHRVLNLCNLSEMLLNIRFQCDLFSYHFTCNFTAIHRQETLNWRLQL